MEHRAQTGSPESIRIRAAHVALKARTPCVALHAAQRMRGVPTYMMRDHCQHLGGEAGGYCQAEAARSLSPKSLWVCGTFAMVVCTNS